MELWKVPAAADCRPSHEAAVTVSSLSLTQVSPVYVFLSPSRWLAINHAGMLYADC